jgi:hypothetical protein
MAMANEKLKISGIGGVFFRSKGPEALAGTRSISASFK